MILAAWNLAEPGVNAPAKSIRFDLQGVRPGATISISRVDATHGNILEAYDKMGQPRYPTPKQQKLLRIAAQLPPAEMERLHAASFTLEIPPEGLAVVTLSK